MAVTTHDSIRLIDPARIDRNPENPRLIFREDELFALQESISEQGILVPLTIYRSSSRFVILDGERRWRCALKLGLPVVPVIIQPEPDAVTNIMMMFAIHKTRNDWDPLPTAIKLEKLEGALAERLGRSPSEQDLATAASISRGEVRRYRNILALPTRYRRKLLDELEKARPLQVLTVDHVLEAVRGANALSGQDVVDKKEATQLADAVVAKFENKILQSTVEPRKLARMARAVYREEIPLSLARKVTLRIISDPNYTINQAFEASVEKVDFEHGTQQLAERTANRLKDHIARHYELGDALRITLRELSKIIRQVIRDAEK